MRKILLAAILSCFCTTAALAQAAAPAAPQGAPSLATWLKNSYTTNRNYLAKAAEKMSEADYGMRPGAQNEVRTFGQIIGHVANANFNYCSAAKGEKNPNQGNDFEKVTAKADLVKALNDALAYCDGVYAEMTDTSAMEAISVGPAGRQTQVVRVSRLIQNFAHNNEHYGNLVTYFRIKGIVPPSSEPRPQ